MISLFHRVRIAAGAQEFTLGMGVFVPSPVHDVLVVFVLRIIPVGDSSRLVPVVAVHLLF